MKYRKKGIKREHSIIEDFEKDLQTLVEEGLIKSAIPGRIYTSPKAQSGKKIITYQYDTETGAKLLMKKGSTVQEVFVITERRQELKEYLKINYII
ncbi:DUF2103 domain-containing protein [Sulfurihydrogenibium azorense]|jgi:hypothetical protein|uniref:Uncharacterized protein n=1 Tax=Sulfurihydrogenibium azorense (strain DSM 15241 / OCM 825 / Az-Fu1) TaxID=204536 RepID=C1DUG5_SULAA|nr:DUF2103 domain-containing protein [Sulfurihydrogenibium azorense]ACN99645.1 conserved hypothetical protein [Sulfurihydrogenibium azorense Az-Fu1]MDM7272875.1 DUF2103 domain-containing protein [Sulfurihydrogenibium azorense]